MIYHLIAIVLGYNTIFFSNEIDQIKTKVTKIIKYKTQLIGWERWPFNAIGT